MDARIPGPRIDAPLPLPLPLFLPLVLLGSLSGCGDDSTGPSSVPAAVRISPLSEPVIVGATVSLSATVLDDTGRAMSGIGVEWASRDTTTVTVDASGGVTAVRMGEGWVVARAGSLSDSVLVDVRFALVPGEGRIRVRGSETFQVAFPEGGAVFIDFLGRDDADFFQTLFVNASGTDTVFATLHPGVPSSGVRDLPAWEPEVLVEGENGLDLPHALAYLVVEGAGPDEARILMSTPPSRMEIEMESVPPGPGSREGMLTARLVTELRRYRVVFGNDGVDFELLPGRDTLYADVRPAFFHWPVGNSSGSVAGGPAPGAWDLRETWWSERFGGFHELDVEDGPPDILVVTPLATEGSVPVAEGESADEALGLRARVSLSQWEPPYFEAWSHSGTFTITRIVPPAGDLYGEVVGTVRAALTGSDWNTSGTFPLEVSLEYHAPVFPAGVAAEAAPLVSGAAATLLRRLGIGFGMPGR